MADSQDKPEKKKKDAVNPNLKRDTIRYLKQLKRSGLHGDALGTVARTLIQDQIKLLISHGALRMEFSFDDDEPDEPQDE